MKILSLEVKDILSFEELKLEFGDSGLVLVDGWNYDAGRGNGAGKTAVFNALTYGLFGKLPRKITASEILRRGSKSGHVMVNVCLPDGVWSVTRGRPSTLIFEKDGEVKTITQEEWESNLKFSYQQFILSVYTAQSTVPGAEPRFLLLNDATKKSFLLRLLNLDQFAECKKTADDAVTALEKAVAAYWSKVEAHQAKVSAYSESLVDDEEIKTQIDAYRSDVNKYSAQIAQYQQVLKPDLTKYQKLEDDLMTKLSDITGTKTKRSMLNDQWRKISNKITPFDGVNECYACGANVDTTDALCAHEAEMKKLKEEAAGIKAQIDHCDSKLLKEAGLNDLYKKIKEKKSSESNEYRVAAEQIQELTSAKKLRLSLMRNLGLKLTNNSELLSKINILQQDIETLNQNIANNQRDIEFYNTVSSVYSATGAQAYILDSIVESFNEVVSSYVDILWPNASYTLNSYRENAKGEVTAKFSETLTMNGKEVSTGSLSGGELKALSLCADFAILDVLETNFGLSTNLVILDEPFDGLDSVGRELVVDLLENTGKKRQIFVVDHASEAKSMFSKSIRIEKKNEVSKLVVEA